MAVDWDAQVLNPLIGIFGQPVIYTLQRGAAFTLNGVFDRYHTEVTLDPSQGVPVSTFKPVLGVRAADFPANTTPTPGDTLMVANAKWLVTDTQPDGHGHIKLMLKVYR